MCLHPERERYENAILNGAMTETQAAAEMGLSHLSTVSRHIHQCVPRRLQAAGIDLDSEAPSVLACIIDAHERTISYIDEAHDAGDLRTCSSLLQTELKQLQYLGTITHQTDTQPGEVQLYLAPVYVQLQELVSSSLVDYPDARTKLGAALARLAAESISDSDSVDRYEYIDEGDG
jgi:hypothetical protein